MRSTCLFYWKQADATHRAVIATAQVLHTCSYCLYAHLIWPIAVRFEHSVFKMLRLALTSLCLAMGEYRECSCLQQGRLAAAADASATASSATSTLQLLPTPRVLPTFRLVFTRLSRRSRRRRPALRCDELSRERVQRQSGQIEVHAVEGAATVHLRQQRREQQQQRQLSGVQAAHHHAQIPQRGEQPCARLCRVASDSGGS